MKYFSFLTVLLFLGFTLQAQAQANAIDKYFQQYLEDERFTIVYISPRLFQMLDRLDIEGFEDEEAKAVMDIAKDLRGLRILTTDVDAGQFYKEAKQKINTTEYEILMTVRNKGKDNVEFLVKENADGIIEELLLLAGTEGDESDTFALISFVGKLDLEKISKLARDIENKE